MTEKYQDPNDELISEQEELYYKQLDADLLKISSAADLEEYVRELEYGYKMGYFEEQPLTEYLGGISGVLGGIEGLCKNYGYEPPKDSDWMWFGRILTIAFPHS